MSVGPWRNEDGQQVRDVTTIVYTHATNGGEIDAVVSRTRLRLLVLLDILWKQRRYEWRWNVDENENEEDCEEER